MFGISKKQKKNLASLKRRHERRGASLREHRRAMRRGASLR